MRQDTLRVAVLGGRAAAIEQIIAAVHDPVELALVVAADDEPELATRLAALNTRPVVAIRERIRLIHGHVYVVAPRSGVALERGELVPVAGDGHAPLDRLLRAVADELGRDGAGVILAGLGADGALGLKRMKEAGGLTIAQWPDDGADGEMPRTAIGTGMVDLVLPLAEIAARLAELGRHTGDHHPSEPVPATGEAIADTLRDILTLLRLRTGHDFSAYKPQTLYRRVARRMQVCQCSSIAGYVDHLRDRPSELQHLLRDFLISVTHFFRDGDAYGALAHLVIPRLFAGKGSADQVRVWVPGCATGEEAYSLAMLLSEHARRLADPPQLQIFATDIDEQALAEARAGRYPKTIELDIGAARLDRFLVPDGVHYRINQELRESIVFSPHNVLRDPPFSRLDLVSCRNLLIYLNREAQDRVLGTFHFALRPEGYLFLGSSESAETTPLFAALDVKHRVYTRRIATTTIGVDSMITTGRWSPRRPQTPAPASERASSFGELHLRLVEQYAPPSVVADDELDIVHVSEHAGRFMQMAAGEPTRQLLRLVHPALRMDLRTAIYAARQTTGTEARRVTFEDGGARRTVELRVKVMDVAELGRGTLLVMFDEQEPPATLPPQQADRFIEPVVREIEDELRRTRDHLRTTIEQYETSLEELKASNEELQATNEELRSATEELETSKEELQAVNEELTTVNHELTGKIDELGRANDDLQNLITSTDIGVVFLDRNLHIKRFTPRVRELVNVIASDIGRPLAHLTHSLDTDALPALAERVLVDLRTIEREVNGRDGRRYFVRLLPYRSLEDRIEGVVITFVEFTDLFDARAARRRSEAALHVVEDRLALALRSAPMIVLVLDPRGTVTWGYVLGREISPLRRLMDVIGRDHAERFTSIAEQVVTSQTGERVELELTIDGARRMYDFRIEPDGDGATAVGFDITPAKQAELALRDADRRKDEFLATLSHELRNPLTPLKVALDVAAMTDDPAQHASARAIMERQVTQLTLLVDELLDLSRITQGKIEIERDEIDPALVIETALEQIRPLIQQHRHELHVRMAPGSVRMIGDHQRLVQVVANLLVNAAKYTPDRGRIDLVVDAAGDTLRIRVRDNGVGIAPDLLPRIFDMFVQSRDAAGRSRTGLGIGLNLAKRLVELHGGTIVASSAGANLGTEMVVELPLGIS